MNQLDLQTLFRKSCDLIFPFILLEDSKQEILTSEGKKALKEGIENFNKILLFDRKNWRAYWFLGKAQQALSLHEEAFNSFLNSHRIALDQEDALRELTLECLYTSRFKEAVYYCNTAIEFSPEDVSLWENMSVVHLFNCNLSEAEKWANKTLNSQISQNVLKIIQEVKDGKKILPISIAELDL